MTGQWDAWLRELKRARKGGVRLHASRGRKHELVINLPGDWTGATLRGEVRASPDAGSVLATYSVTGPVVGSGRSVFTCSLAAGTGSDSTGVLPPDSDMDGVAEFPVDLLLTPLGGTEELLLGFELSLIGRITV